MSESLWYYEEDGRQAGPVSGAALEEAIRTGRLAAGMRVWRAGMPGWKPWEEVPELASLAAPPPAPAPVPWSQPGAAPTASPSPAAQPGGGAAPPTQAGGWAPPASAGQAVGPLQPVGVLPTILLSVVTFSIYGLVRFYQCAKAYERAAGVGRSRFDPAFWAHLGLALGAVVFFWLRPLSVVLAVASTAAGFLALTACLEARDALVRQTGARADLLPAQTHRLVWVGAKLVSTVPSMPFALLGLAGVIFQAVRFFADHDALAAALAGRRPQAS